MSSRLAFRKAYFSLWLVLVGVAHAQGTMVTLTFEEFPLPFPGEGMAVPNGYGSLQWAGFTIVTGAPGPSGFDYAAVSTPNFILNGAGEAQISSSTPFDLNSAYLIAGYRDGLQVEVQGFVGSALQYDNVYTIDAVSPTLIAFNYFGVNQVTFNSYGGIQVYRWPGENFGMDNMTVTVPEPSELNLLALGVVCMLGSVVRRRWGL